MNNNNFSQALERISQLQYQERLPSKLIKGSHALLFLERYRLLSLYAKKMSYENEWLDDYFIVSNTPFFSDVIFNKEIEQLMQGKYRYTSEFLYLNWEFHKLTLCKILNCDISNLPNPYEPTIIFMERGGGATFFSPFGFNIGNIFIRKPKFEKIVDLPPFITFNESSYKSADDEYIKDKAAFFEKYIRPVF